MTLDEVKQLSDADLVLTIVRITQPFNSEYVENCRANLHAYPQEDWLNVLGNWGFQIYPHDLNAMHEVFMRFEDAMGSAYWHNLYLVLDGQRKELMTWNWLVHVATARQRAEAFVLTMEGGKK